MVFRSGSMPRSLAALGALALASAPTAARAQFGASYGVSPAVSLTVSFGQKVMFGLGLDVRATALFPPSEPIVGCANGPVAPRKAGVGPFAQITWLNFSHWRVASGVHGGGEVIAQTLAFDGELGWTYHTRYDDEHPGEHGLQLGVVGQGTPSVDGIPPSLEVPVRVALPFSSPVFAPEVTAGASLRWPPVFSFPASHCVF
jgi:hypothetical protein